MGFSEAVALFDEAADFWGEVGVELFPVSLWDGEI